MSACKFCGIIAGKAFGEIVYKDELVTAFRDIHPVAPTHILIVPNRHIESVNDVTAADEPAMGRLLTAARVLAEQEGLSASGYRLILNTGPNAGQVVYHLHLHLLGGQKMHYPIG